MAVSGICSHTYASGFTLDPAAIGIAAGRIIFPDTHRAACNAMMIGESDGLDLFPALLFRASIHRALAASR